MLKVIDTFVGKFVNEMDINFPTKSNEMCCKLNGDGWEKKAEKEKQ